MEAVLFDFDGVIANTLSYHVRAWNEAFQEYGITVQPIDMASQEGKGANAICASIAGTYGLKLTNEQIAEITANKREIYRHVTKASVYPETQRFIDELKSRSVPMALVTGSVLPSICEVVDQDFLDQFEVVITQRDVTYTKPHPEPFLKAAELMKIEPEKCVVIENAPMGITAAKAAGMFCVALRTTIPDDELINHADLIVDDAGKIDLSLPAFAVTDGII